MKTNKTINYIGRNNEYIVKNRKKRIVLKTSAKILIYVFFSLLSFVFAIYQFKLCNKAITNSQVVIDYSISGKSDYQVYLKDNDYYKEKYLKSGMQYIAKLIKSIDLNFNYEAHSTDKIDYLYKYDVRAKTVVTDKYDKSKILFEKEETLIDEKTLDTNSNNFVINENVAINYDKYNDYIIKYKKEYSLNTEINLIVTMHIETVGKSEISEKDINHQNDFNIVIPLSEQTINITNDNSRIQTNGSISGKVDKTLAIRLLYANGVLLILVSCVLLIRTLIIILAQNKSKGIYNRTITKYLKEYDRAIVTTHKSSVDEHDYSQVIRVLSIEEMLDLHDNLKLPILYYEVVKGEKSYFIIIKDNVLYKLTISKKWLEENEENK